MHADPYLGVFPPPVLPDLRLLAHIDRCTVCGSWMFRSRCTTPHERTTDGH